MDVAPRCQLSVSCDCMSETREAGQLRESAAYAVLCAVVRQKGRYLVCSPKEQAAHGRAFEELVAAKFKKTGAHLSRIAAPCGGLFER